MSRSTDCATVPFAASSNISFDLLNYKNDDELKNKLAILHNPIEAYEYEILGVEVEEEEDFEYNGWTINMSNVETYKNLYVTPWCKNNKKVYVINESEYSSVCITEITFFAKNKQDLVDFLKDQNLDFKIKAKQAVQQTM